MPCHRAHAHAGTIETPGGGQREYPAHMDSRVEVAVPRDHAVMVSLQYMDVDPGTGSYCRDRVRLYRDTAHYRHVQWTACSEPRPPPALYRMDRMIVRWACTTIDH